MEPGPTNGPSTEPTESSQLTHFLFKPHTTGTLARIFKCVHALSVLWLRVCFESVSSPVHLILVI